MTDKLNTTNCVRFDDFVIDLDTPAMWRNRATVEMPNRSLRFIVLLLRQAGDIVDKDTLIDTLWPDQDVSDWSLSRLVSDTRQLLGDTVQDQRYIQTIRNKGFRWNPQLPTEPAEAPVPPSVSIAAKARSGWSRAGVAAVLVLATIGTVLALRPRFA
ncbi:MAG: winged helix-turn-helix domain-containing protein, partial [Pseudomonadota bacterium]